MWGTILCMNTSKSKPNFALSIINDEIDQDFEETLKFLRLNKIDFVEVRTINNKNILDFSRLEIIELKKLLQKYEIRVSAISSPLFKWYPRHPQINDAKSSFGFPEYLDTNSKVHYIKHAFHIAKSLKTKSIRIFSLLMDNDTQERSDFWELEPETFGIALNLSSEYKIKLLVENGFSTNFRKWSQIINWDNYYSKSGFDPLFDFANARYIGEQVNVSEIHCISPFIGHLHVKDYQESSQKIVPFGTGDIDWGNILTQISQGATRKVMLSLEFDGKYDKKIISETIDNLRTSISKINT